MTILTIYSKSNYNHAMHIYFAATTLKIKRNVASSKCIHLEEAMFLLIVSIDSRGYPILRLLGVSIWRHLNSV